MSEERFKIINTDTNNGQTKCKKCGASNLYYDQVKHKLVCNYCFSEFDQNSIDGKENADSLDGELRGSATKKINHQASDLITIKCDGCGAEVVLNTNKSLSTCCHWCGSTLSINHQIDNGIVPDEILPFSLLKEYALAKMKYYIRNHLSFTTKDFVNGLTIDNIRGVYFPYLIFDTKAHGKYTGVGEHTTRCYRIDDDTYYDADIFHIEREFDIVVDDLTIESNFNRLDRFNPKQRNSVINAIMPFDTQNCIQFNAIYMKDYTSEKRDVDIETLEGKVKSEVHDIARMKINESLKKYGRGVRWEQEIIDFAGKQWISAYLPVWLYSYQDQKGVIHYIAVNGRTGETVGSIPLDKNKLWTIILLIAIPCLFFGFLISILFLPLGLLIMVAGFFTSLILFIVEDYKYSNLVWKRHRYEAETRCDLQYTNCVDQKIDEIHKTRVAFTRGTNNRKIHGDYIRINQNTK